MGVGNINLSIKNLSKMYKNKYALKNVSMNVEKGQIVGLIGRNGAGKTTLLNCIAGNIFVNSGEIIFNDKNILKDTRVISDFGILIEPKFLDYLTAYENLKLLSYASNMTDNIAENIDEILKIVSLEKEKKNYVKNFSFGMKQRLGLAQALLNAKTLLILDEPLVGLDVLGRELIKEIIIKKAKEGVSVLFSDHNLKEVNDICDKIVCIENGEKIFDGVFENKKEYQILIKKTDKIDRMSQELKSDIVVENNEKIILRDGDNINDTVAYLVKNEIFIKDIIIKENSLLEMFKAGDGFEN